MSINASANLSVQVANGPTLSYAWVMSADAIDRLTVIVKAGTNTTVDLQPAAGAKVLFVGLTSTDTSGKITCDTLFGVTFPITGPQVLVGSALINHLNANPTSVKLTNAAAADATVDIVVLRTV